MLKITAHHQPTHTALQLEGAITGPWIDELRRHLITSTPPIIFDLAGITYMDQAAAQLIEDSLHQGATIRVCSHFAALMLRQDSK
jgi:anti-anti-sigma regulatory factor